ncbi:MAG: META domain-containing protein [Acidimicrobiales bacterium]
MRSRPASTALAGLVAIVAPLAAACGETADSLTTSAPLDGVWLLDTSDGDPAEFVLQIEVDHAIVSAQGPCHLLRGSLTATDDGVATFTLPGSGAASCPDDELATELAFVDAMEQIERWELDGSTLTLSGADTTLVFTQ